MNTALQIASKMEEIRALNNDGAQAIRELVNALANFEQADKLMDLIADRYENLAVTQEAILQENLRLEREFVRLALRVLKLEEANGERRESTAAT